MMSEMHEAGCGWDVLYLWYSPSSSSDTNGTRRRMAMTPVSVGSRRSTSRARARGTSGRPDLVVATKFRRTGAGCEPIHFRTTPSMILYAWVGRAKSRHVIMMMIHFHYKE